MFELSVIAQIEEGIDASTRHECDQGNLAKYGFPILPERPLAIRNDRSEGGDKSEESHAARVN